MIPDLSTYLGIGMGQQRQLTLPGYKMKKIGVELYQFQGEFGMFNVKLFNLLQAQIGRIKNTIRFQGHL